MAGPGRTQFPELNVRNVFADRWGEGAPQAGCARAPGKLLSAVGRAPPRSRAGKETRILLAAAQGDQIKPH